MRAAADVALETVGRRVVETHDEVVRIDLSAETRAEQRPGAAHYGTRGRRDAVQSTGTSVQSSLSVCFFPIFHRIMMRVGETCSVCLVSKVQSGSLDYSSGSGSFPCQTM